MTKLMEAQLTPCSVLTQKRTKRMLPPYREDNIEEKEMKRLEGISQCPTNCLCSRNIEISYKNARLLSQFTSQQTGRILPRTITKVCIKMQQKISKEIRKARAMVFLPYTESLLQYHGDPKLFNSSRAKTEMYLQINRERELTSSQKYQSYDLGK